MARFSYNHQLNELDMMLALKVVNEIEDITPTHWVTVDMRSSLSCQCFAKCMTEHKLPKNKFKGYLRVSAEDVSFRVCDIGPSNQIMDSILTYY